MNLIKKNIYIAFSLLAAMPCFPNDLSGTWTEDVEKTIQWNKEHTKIDDEFLERLEAISGHFYMEFKDGVMCQYFEPYSFSYQGKEHQVTRLTTQHAKYNVIAKNEYGLVYELEYASGEIQIEAVVFENENSLYGFQLTTENYGHPGLRVYLKPATKNEWSFDCDFT